MRSVGRPRRVSPPAHLNSECRTDSRKDSLGSLATDHQNGGVGGERSGVADAGVPRVPEYLDRPDHAGQHGLTPEHAADFGPDTRQGAQGAPIGRPPARFRRTSAARLTLDDFEGYGRQRA